MAVGDLLRYARRVLFPKATPEQQLLRLVKPHPIRRVVELGVDSLGVSTLLLDTLVKREPADPVHYTAFDSFDDRPEDDEPLSLVAAYRRVVATKARVRLTPGSLERSLAAEANALVNTDLLLLGRRATGEAIGNGWFFLPRMLHPGTLVVQRVTPAEADAPDWRVVPVGEVLARGAASRSLRAA